MPAFQLALQFLIIRGAAMILLGIILLGILKDIIRLCRDCICRGFGIIVDGGIVRDHFGNGRATTGGCIQLKLNKTS